MEKPKYILLSNKLWHRDLFQSLQKTRPHEEWILITKEHQFSLEDLNKIKPSKIFIPHWSQIIKEDIFSAFECIVFHMTDLPYGRGGSPLQNLIVRGHQETKLTALRVDKGLDSGPIFIKKKLRLSGSAEEIFIRASGIIFDMIQIIIDENIDPIKQEGSPIYFKRRTPEQSDIDGLLGLEQVYNHIRMLDCPGYPKAFFENSEFRFEFSNSKIEGGKILANVEITKK